MNHFYMKNMPSQVMQCAEDYLKFCPFPGRDAMNAPSQVMQCAEDYLKFCVQYAYDNCRGDLEFFDKHVEKGLLKRLENLLGSAFGRLPYTEAIELLDKEVNCYSLSSNNVQYGPTPDLNIAYFFLTAMCRKQCRRL